MRPLQNDDDEATGVAISPDGSTLCVTGYSLDLLTFDYATVALGMT
jgi:hypothetical protein